MPRILKFGTNFGYDKLYCVWLTSPFICPFFFHSNKFFHHISPASMSARVFKFCIHDQVDQLYCYKQNQGAEIYLSLLFFPSSISHSNVMNKEIFVKDFSGTTRLRILKFGTNIRYDTMY